jgi:hypothetical protein
LGPWMRFSCQFVKLLMRTGKRFPSFLKNNK